MSMHSLSCFLYVFSFVSGFVVRAFCFGGECHWRKQDDDCATCPGVAGSMSGLRYGRVDDGSFGAFTLASRARRKQLERRFRIQVALVMIKTRSEKANARATLP